MKKKDESKIIILFLCMLLFLAVNGCGSNKRNNRKGETSLSSIKDIQQEAKDFNYDGSVLDMSKADIRIPEVSEIYDISFDFFDRDSGEVEELFLDDLAVLIGCDEMDIDKTHAGYSVKEWIEVENEYDDPIVEHKYSFEDAPDNVKSDIGSFISYNDGRYSMLLYQSSYMCEYSDNKIPKEITRDENDYTDITWGYRALDLGTPYKTFYPLKDDITDVAYKMWDGSEYLLSEAILFAESYAKSHYKIGGSDILNYHVYMVDVRKIADDRYYYQMYICTSYKGVNMEYDSYYERDDNDYLYYHDSHYMCIFEKDNCSYMWSCCNSFDNVEITKKYTELISLESACDVIEKEFSKNKKLKVNSVELQYATRFRTIEKGDDSQYLVGAEVHPVYHFVVKNPKILSYTTIMFDVDAIDGSVVVMYK